jgi:hypothetical protein
MFTFLAFSIASMLCLLQRHWQVEFHITAVFIHTLMARHSKFMAETFALEKIMMSWVNAEAIE